MSVIRGMIIAFSIYSKIPVPIFNWKDEDMKYHLIFFPWIGAVIGGLLCGWSFLSEYFSIGRIAYVLIGFAIPIIVTGGFHVDGYMDTCDALKSYKPKEEKLKILSDPHIGAFAVISFATVSAIYIAAFSEIGKKGIPVFAFSFVISRCLSGLSVLTFRNAKDTGMLHTFSKTGEKAKKAVITALIIQFFLCCIFMVKLDLILGVALSVTSCLCLILYRQKMIRQLGGITGDTAGYFVVMTETCMAVVAAIAS